MLVCDALTCVGLRGYDKSRYNESGDNLQLEPFEATMDYQEVREKGKLTGEERLSKDE